MSYINELLANNEQIRYEARQHTFVLIARVVTETVLLAIILFAMWFINRYLSNGSQSAQWAQAQPWLLLILGAIGVIILLSAIYDILKWRNELFVLTDRRVIHLQGIINKASIDSSLEKINDVQMRQSFWGRMFNFGDLEIQTASEDGTNYLRHIHGPLDFKRAMLNAKSETENSMRVYAADPAAAYQKAPQRMSADEIEAQLVRLADLRQKNLITDEDFDAKKREILSRL